MKDELKKYDSGQILQASFDNENACLKIRHILDEYDYIQVLYPDSKTETYIYKKGGENGTIIAVITLEYTDSTKENLNKVVKI